VDERIAASPKIQSNRFFQTNFRETTKILLGLLNQMQEVLQWNQPTAWHLNLRQPTWKGIDDGVTLEIAASSFPFFVDRKILGKDFRV
jgi:hypothetical protein